MHNDWIDLNPNILHNLYIFLKLSFYYTYSVIKWKKLKLIFCKRNLLSMESVFSWAKEDIALDNIWNCIREFCDCLETVTFKIYIANKKNLPCIFYYKFHSFKHSCLNFQLERRASGRILKNWWVVQHHSVLRHQTCCRTKPGRFCSPPRRRRDTTCLTRHLRPPRPQRPLTTLMRSHGYGLR